VITIDSNIVIGNRHPGSFEIHFVIISFEVSSFFVRNMDLETITRNYNRELDHWIDTCKTYTEQQLLLNPRRDSWSLGQLGMHLIVNTWYFFKLVRICASTEQHSAKEMSSNASRMFLRNEFPNLLMEGPPLNKETPQPSNRDEVVKGLRSLKAEMNTISSPLANNRAKGKTRHPGLHYFDAMAWFQFSEMHFRHHLKQKKRIESFLGIYRERA